MAVVDVLKYVFQIDNKGFNTEIQKTDKTVKKLSDNISDKLTVAIKGMIGAFSVYQTIRIYDTLARDAAQAERVAYSFDRIARSAGVASGALIHELREASKNTIDDVTLMVQASRAEIMGLAIEDMPKLMVVARAAAKAMGKTTKQMFEDIVTGTARDSKMILDNLGILINAEAMYRKETERLGRELTDAEKKQALWNDVLKQGGRIVNIIGEDFADSADNVDQFTASFKNMTTELGKFATTTGIYANLATIFREIRDTFKGINIELEDKTIPLWKSYGTVITRFLLNPLRAIRGYNIKADLEEAKEAVEEFIGPVDQIDTSAEDLEKTMTEILKRTKGFKKEIRETREEFTGLAKISQILKESFGLTGEAKMILKAELAPKVLISEDISLFEDINNQIKLFMMENEKAAQALRGTFLAIVNNMNGFAKEMATIFYNLIKGDFASAAFNFVNIIISIFTKTSESQQNIKRGMESLNRVYERNVELIRQMTISETELHEIRLKEAIAAIERLGEVWNGFVEYLTQEEVAKAFKDVVDALINLGFTAEEAANIAGNMELHGEAVQNMLNQLQDLNNLFAEYETLRGVKNVNDLIRFIQETGGIDYSAASSIIRHFVDMFDLSVEEQIELWELLLATLEASGDATVEELMAIERTIESLNDRVEEGNRIMQDSSPTSQSQIIRNITSITESQGNLIVDVLNSIHAELRRILAMMRDSMKDIRSMTLSISTINIYAGSYENGQSAANGFISELRANGIKVSGR